jgi:multidrug resistance efflux pump
MIAFLTLCYCAVLYLLVRFGVIRLTLGWKLSPVAWLLLLLVLLFIPMQWGAPQGAVTLFRTVVEIVPNVSGQVIEVPAQGLAPLKTGDVLFRIDPRPYRYELGRIQAGLDEARADSRLAKLELDRNLQAAKTNAVAARDVDVWRARYASAQARIASFEHQLENAQFNLDETTVRAPADGYVMGLTLRPGQRVSSAPLRSWMAFVDEARTYLVVGIQQYALRNVEPGQAAEVVFKIRPGKTYAARVRSVTRFGSQGQLSPSGAIPATPTGADPPLPYGVILDLDAGAEALRELPAGATGSAAIYTNSAAATHLIRRVMMRMQTFINYVNPW